MKVCWKWKRQVENSCQPFSAQTRNFKISKVALAEKCPSYFWNVPLSLLLQSSSLQSSSSPSSQSGRPELVWPEPARGFGFKGPPVLLYSSNAVSHTRVANHHHHHRNHHHHHYCKLHHQIFLLQDVWKGETRKTEIPDVFFSTALIAAKHNGKDMRTLNLATKWLEFHQNKVSLGKHRRCWWIYYMLPYSALWAYRGPYKLCLVVKLSRWTAS